MRFQPPIRGSTTAALALLTLMVPLARADGPPPSAATSAADVQTLLDANNYAGAVSAASRLLSKAGNAPGPDADKAQLYALKGEAHLKLKQATQAADAFDKASKAATDPAVSATDAATGLLAKRSRNNVYTPKQPAADGTKPSPVDITAADDRKTALGYLFADEFAAAAPKLKAAKTAKTVPEMLRAADLANGLRSLEVAATGSDDKSKPEVTEIADHAQGLLDTSLKTMAQRVGDIRQAANAQSTQYGRQRMANGGYANEPQVHKAGLTSRNVSELKQIESDCKQIGPAADAFAKAVAEGGTTPAAAAPAAPAGAAPAAAGGAAGGSGWDALSAEAGRIASQCEDVLTADYGNGATPQRR